MAHQQEGLVKVHVQLAWVVQMGFSTVCKETSLLLVQSAIKKKIYILKGYKKFLKPYASVWKLLRHYVGFPEGHIIRKIVIITSLEWTWHRILAVISFITNRERHTHSYVCGGAQSNDPQSMDHPLNRL